MACSLVSVMIDGFSGVDRCGFRKTKRATLTLSITREGLKNTDLQIYHSPSRNQLNTML